MNFTKTFIITAISMIASLSAMADIGFSNLSVAGTALGGSGTNYAVISSRSFTGGEPSVLYLNVNGLDADSAVTLTAYVSTNQTTGLTGFTNTTTTNFVTSTNFFVAGDWVVIQHLSLAPRFQTEAGIVSAVQATNQIVLGTALVNPFLPGDVMNREIPNGTIPIANSTTAREISNGAGIITGQRVEPLLLTLVSVGAATNTINVATATYSPSVNE